MAYRLNCYNQKAASYTALRKRSNVICTTTLRRLRALPSASVVTKCFSSSDMIGDPDSTDYGEVAARLNKLLTRPSITGRQLRDLIVDKWGRTYDVRLAKRGSKMYLQVMWKFLEQQSFPLTEEEYMMQLDAVAEYLTDWGVADSVRAAIAAASRRGPGYTVGGNAKCISIPLDVDLSGNRSGEFKR